MIEPKNNTPAGWLFHLLEQALLVGASDIHVFHISKGAQVQFRVHGTMEKQVDFSPTQALALANIIRLQSGMDISISHQPQDGRFSWAFQNRTVDIRVASLPTVFGQDFVLRLFAKTPDEMDLERLGFLPGPFQSISAMLEQKSGLILVTGPTGSGKTTTLYAMVNDLKKRGNPNIVTLEDPVETILEGVRQSQINLKGGYTFESGLRAILRQDPDVILIGEIRDAETAKIAIEASYTGHLVLSTLHTTDVRTSLLRLMHFELDLFLVAHTLRGIISQRLILRPGGGGRTALTEIFTLKTLSPRFDKNRFMESLLVEGALYPFEEDLVRKTVPEGE